ncbi:hypothetical protein B0H19DRAFT_1142575 [Mycena capillaripes]|nr:hypothetical protein B0H19DRAFT_1142575 [Mycena capillaripes]
MAHGLLNCFLGTPIYYVVSWLPSLVRASERSNASRHSRGVWHGHGHGRVFPCVARPLISWVVRPRQWWLL